MLHLLSCFMLFKPVRKTHSSTSKTFSCRNCFCYVFVFFVCFFSVTVCIFLWKSHAYYKEIQNNASWKQNWCNLVTICCFFWKREETKYEIKSCCKPEYVSLKRSICVLTSECLDWLKLYLFVVSHWALPVLLSSPRSLPSLWSGQNDSENTRCFNWG